MAKKEQAYISHIDSSIEAGEANETRREQTDLDKLLVIRDLLFGEEVARIDAKIEDYQRQVENRLGDIEAKIEITGQRIQDFIQASVNELYESLSNQNLKHIEEEDKLEKKLEDVGCKLSELKAFTQQDLSNTHNEIKQVSQDIYRSLQLEVGELATRIDNTSRELSANKADKKTIANLLAGMANNLNQINV